MHDRADGQHRFPVLAQDVEADVAVQVDVWVVDLGLALDLGGVVRVAGGDTEVKQELAPPAGQKRMWKARVMGWVVKEVNRLPRGLAAVAEPHQAEWRCC